MLEPLFGSSTPMWTAFPLTGFAVQPQIPVAGNALGASPLGASVAPWAAGGLTAGTPSTSAPSVAPGSPQGFGLPFAINPSFAINAPDAMAGLTPTALLTAVAIRRGQPQGPANDQDVEDFIYDVLDMLTGANDVEARCEGGKVTLTGSVPHKRVKRDVGEIAWAIPGLHDVQNNVTIASRRRPRTVHRESDGSAERVMAPRK